MLLLYKYIVERFNKLRMYRTPCVDLGVCFLPLFLPLLKSAKVLVLRLPVSVCSSMTTYFFMKIFYNRQFTNPNVYVSFNPRIPFIFRFDTMYDLSDPFPRPLSRRTHRPQHQADIFFDHSLEVMFGFFEFIFSSEGPEIIFFSVVFSFTFLFLFMSVLLMFDAGETNVYRFYDLCLLFFYAMG